MIARSREWMPAALGHPVTSIQSPAISTADKFSRIALVCPFEEDTACGIVLRGKAEALAALDHDVQLLYLPFKYASRRPSGRMQAGSRLCVHAIYAAFFGRRGPLKWCLAPALLRDAVRALRVMTRCRVVVFQKPLPQTLFFMGLLRLARFRGKILCIYDDWEGIGGMATNRRPEKVLRKVLISLAEEYVPVMADGNICSSRLLVEKLSLSPRTAGRVLYSPGGACRAACRPRPQPEGTRPGFTVGYVGTFKSRHLADFLADTIEAASSQDAEVGFLLIGGGEALDHLRNRIRDAALSARVRFTGQLGHREALRTLDAADLCLLYLNDRFPEAYVDASRSSVKMFEYMAMGKPMIASRFGEPEEILRDGVTAWLSENTPRAFAGKILLAKSRPAVARAMGERVRADFTARYSHEVLMADLLRWIARL